MKYEKPEVAVLGSAVVAIHGCTKGIIYPDSNTGCSDTTHTVVSAYEADE
jgi:hypothetical protein